MASRRGSIRRPARSTKQIGKDVLSDPELSNNIIGLLKSQAVCAMRISQ